MSTCSNCGLPASVIIAEAGPSLRLPCLGCFEDEGGEVPSQPIPNNILDFDPQGKGGGDGDDD
jgi:hypothetical protein